MVVACNQKYLESEIEQSGCTLCTLDSTQLEPFSILLFLEMHAPLTHVPKLAKLLKAVEKDLVKC